MAVAVREGGTPLRTSRTDRRRQPRVTRVSRWHGAWFLSHMREHVRSTMTARSYRVRPQAARFGASSRCSGSQIDVDAWIADLLTCEGGRCAGPGGTGRVMDGRVRAWMAERNEATDMGAAWQAATGSGAVKNHG